MNFLLGVLIIGPLLVILLVMAILKSALENLIVKAGNFYMNIMAAMGRKKR